jgi:hypothetical protein
MTRDIDEAAFGTGLTRVVKKVKRGNKTVDQAFHVKKAAPGDKYASTKAPEMKPPKKAAAQDPQQPAIQPPGVNQTVDQLDGVMGQEVQPAAPIRISVRPRQAPWVKRKTGKEDQDPVPKELRRRFDKDKRSLPIFTNPAVTGSPIMTVVPTDKLFWGADEPDLLMSLRHGDIKKMRLVGGSNGLMIAKIEARGGGSFYGFMWMESLRCSLIRQLWGGIIDFVTEEGTLSRRAACAYEVAKAAGLDDLTPPTVHRIDDDGDIMSMLPDSLIEQATEWVSRTTGKDPETVRKKLGAHATVQLIRDDPWPVESENWFRDLFGRPSDALNNVWDAMPPDRRFGFLRVAALDFAIGCLDRSWGDMAFSDNPRHPVMVFGGELSITCPRTIGIEYATGSYGSYSDEIPGTLPLLWSEPLTMLVVRGGDAEIADFEKIGISIATRMRGDRAVELARSLLEHKATPLQICGVLSRLWMMETWSKDIAKDPYFAARYYAAVVSGGANQIFKGVEDFVNNTMHKVLVRDFDFYTEMESGGADETDL